MTYRSLQRQATSLEKRIEALQTKGNCLQDHWIDFARNSTGKEFARLRWMENGKRKAKVLTPEEISATRSAIVRGEKLAQLQHQLQQIQLQLSAVRQQIKQLGGKLPDLSLFVFFSSLFRSQGDIFPYSPMVLSRFPSAPEDEESLSLEFTYNAIPKGVLTAIRNATIAPCPAKGVLLKGYSLDLPQLSANQYKQFKQILIALRGKWVRGSLHWFPYDPTVAIAQVVDAGNIPKINPYALFPTPPETAVELLDFMGMPKGKNHKPDLLESSAGLGNIALEMRQRLPNATVHTVEIDNFNRQVLRQLGFTLVGRDWLTTRAPQLYDFAAINPPFDGTTYVDHILKTWQSVRPNGVLGSIVPANLLWHSTKKIVNLRNMVAKYGSWRSIGSPFDGVSVECFIIAMKKKSVAKLMQPTNSGYLSEYHAAIAELLESNEGWDDFCQRLRQRNYDPTEMHSYQKLKTEIGDRLDGFVQTFISRQHRCLLYDATVKGQVVTATIEELFEED